MSDGKETFRKGRLLFEGISREYLPTVIKGQFNASQDYPTLIVKGDGERFNIYLARKEAPEKVARIDGKITPDTAKFMISLYEYGGLKQNLYPTNILELFEKIRKLQNDGYRLEFSEPPADKEE